MEALKNEVRQERNNRLHQQDLAIVSERERYSQEKDAEQCRAAIIKLQVQVDELRMKYEPGQSETSFSQSHKFWLSSRAEQCPLCILTLWA